MRLYLVQHGESQPESVSPERERTPRGRSDIERLASLLGERAVRVARIVHSGKTRARQTAEILAARLAPRIAPETLEDINPNDPVAPVADRVRGRTKDTLLAGHLPFVDRMATLLVTRREEPPVVAFQPGSAACLERDAAGLWVIDWMLRPEPLAGR